MWRLWASVICGCDVMMLSVQAWRAVFFYQTLTYLTQTQAEDSDSRCLYKAQTRLKCLHVRLSSYFILSAIWRGNLSRYESFLHNTLRFSIFNVVIFKERPSIWPSQENTTEWECVHNLLLCNCLFSETVKKLHLFDHKYSNIVTIWNRFLF